MFVITVTFVVAEEHLDDFDRAMEAQARASLENEADCIQFDVCRDPDDPTVCFLYEVYTDKAAFHSHMESPHFKSFNATVEPWVESKIVEAYERTWPKG